jgi:hypothetical protein
MIRRKPIAVIVDVDGTLADVRDIRHHVATKPKDFDAFHAASAHVPPNQQAIDFVLKHHAAGHVIVVVTARRQHWADVTTDWLKRHMPVPFDGPFHRQDDDFRPDFQVKKDIHTYLARNYDIRAACDDNPNVIALWTKIGIPVDVVPGWE